MQRWAIWYAYSHVVSCKYQAIKKCDVHANYSSVSVNCMVSISALSLSGGYNQQQATPPPQVTPTNDWLCKLPISLEDDQPDLRGKEWPDVWADSAFKEDWR